MDSSAGQFYTITVNGISLSVMENLLHGLKRIRQSNESIPIWIDALCINQSDDAEQSFQVAMMADIYVGAKSVVIWLGEGQDPAEDEIFKGITVHFDLPCY